MASPIADIRDPNLFQRLVRILFATEKGRSFQTVDDSAGDRGNDGYNPESGWLVAIYCPEKGMQRKAALEKGREDLKKAVRLLRNPTYDFKEWVFITPEPLPEMVQATLRAEAQSAGLRATFLSADNLEPIYLKYRHLHDLFPALTYPKVQEELKALNAKMDRLLPATSAIETSSPITPTPNVTPKSTAYSVDLFPGFRSAVLSDLQKRLYDGDKDARHELERYRLETTDTRERLVALMIEIDYEGDRLNHKTVQRLAAEGLNLASQKGATAEAAVFRARLAYAKNAELVFEESQFIGKLGMSMTVGLPLVKDAETQWYDDQVPKERQEINDSFKRAYAEARDSNNLMSLFRVVLLYANATAQTVFPLLMPGRELLTGDIPQRIAHAKGIVEGAYDLAVTLARSMGSKDLLAMTYSNFANDLTVFAEYERALSHATTALEMAKDLDDKQQFQKTERLIQGIKDKMAKGTPPVRRS